MKFGQTLHERSVPQWAMHNLNYNELKQLLKERTGQGPASAVPIPGQSDHRWSLLEDELYGLLNNEYNNIALFVRSKHGELDRRLAYLEKSTRTTRRAAAAYAGRPNLQARKYQKLTQDLNALGGDIENLAQFSSTQKLAFKKILKKYKKWTNSSSLQCRLERDVFSKAELDIDTTGQMQKLTGLQVHVNNDLQSILFSNGPFTSSTSSTIPSTDSPIGQIQASEQNDLLFHATLMTAPFGESASMATYWIHIDNLEAAKVMLLRYVKELEQGENKQTIHTAYLDNGARYAQDSSSTRPTQVAFTAVWNSDKNAFVAMSDLARTSSTVTIHEIKKKELAIAIDRSSVHNLDKDSKVVADYLLQHRDIKPLAASSMQKHNYVGISNSNEVALWATMSTDISFSSYDPILSNDKTHLPSDSTPFPHTVLSVRWEFSKKPELVHTLDSSHLAEKVKDFSIEHAAIHNRHPELLEPTWLALLQEDIRKVPVLRKHSRRVDSTTTGNSNRSSTDDAPSVFSIPEQEAVGRESETSPMASTSELTPAIAKKKNVSSKKRTRIDAISPQPSSSKYYSEYDDPDSELYQGNEAYTIYVDPDAEAPGMATLKKIGRFFWSKKQNPPDSRSKRSSPDERTGLLNNIEDDADSASLDSETDTAIVKKPIHKGIPGRRSVSEQYQAKLTRRQRQHEKTLIRLTYGLLALSYIFLLMSAAILASGRRKQVLTVDVGATIGVVAAFICVISSVVLVYMRKSVLLLVEKTALALLITTVLIVGGGLVAGIVQRAGFAQ